MFRIKKNKKIRGSVFLIFLILKIRVSRIKKIKKIGGSVFLIFLILEIRVSRIKKIKKIEKNKKIIVSNFWPSRIPKIISRIKKIKKIRGSVFLFFFNSQN